MITKTQLSHVVFGYVYSETSKYNSTNQILVTTHQKQCLYFVFYIPINVIAIVVVVVVLFVRQQQQCKVMPVRLNRSGEWCAGVLGTFSHSGW